MKTLLFTIQTLFSRFFFGERCIGCAAPGTSLCVNCIRTIPQAEPSLTPTIYSMYSYGNTLVRKAIWNLKYKHNGKAAARLASEAQDILNDIIFETTHATTALQIIFIPIPLHKNRTRTRGFNQSTFIAQCWAQIFPESSLSSVLIKHSATVPQVQLKKKAERLHNITGTLSIAPAVIINAHILYIVVDDVTTTGATFLEAVRVLREAGAKHILCIALAHGYKN